MHEYFDEPEQAPYDPRIARRLLRFILPYRAYVGLALVLLLAMASVEVALPYLVKVAIDDYITAGDFRGLTGISFIFLGFLIIQVILAGSRAYLTNWIGQQAMHDLRQRLFEQLQRLPVPFYDRNPIGRLVTRVTSDVQVLNELFSSGVVAILSDIFLLGAVTVMMFVLDLRLSLVVFIVLPLILGTSWTFRTWMREAYRQIRLRVARLNTYLQEQVTGLVIVQLFRREEASTSDFEDHSLSLRDAHLRSIFYHALFNPLIELLTAVAVALLIWYGGGRILQGTLTLGVLVAFLQYSQKFFHPIRDLADKYNLLLAAMASGERLVALLDEPVADEPGIDVTEVASMLPEPRGEIEFDDVWFAYEPDNWVLQGVSFKVPAGSRLALVGSTGAGKTTCINLLCRFYEVSRGRILLDGLDIHDYPTTVLRERIGLVLQDVFLFSGSVHDNVRLGDAEIDELQVDVALGAIGADRFVTTLPEGKETAVGERGRTLSTGQKQLIAFARALAYDPRVLILDEATSSVDSATEALIEEAIGKLMAGRTSIAIAHRLSTIRRVDSILVLHHGKVRESGTHEELLAAGGLYTRLYQLQYAEQTGVSATVSRDEPS